MTSDIPALSAEQFATLLMQMQKVADEGSDHGSEYAKGIRTGARACIVSAAVLAQINTADVIDGTLEATLKERFGID